MDVRDALKGQYHAAYGMLRECVEVCPDDLWFAGEKPRFFWRIAYHAAFFGRLYMVQNEAVFVPWAKHVEEAVELWGDNPKLVDAYTRDEVMAYIDEVRAQVDSTIDGLDLDTSDSGFHWYPNITKLEHELLSVRHIQGHVGQLSERLFAAGIDTKWISRRM